MEPNESSIEIRIAIKAAAANSARRVNPSIVATGLRSHAARYDALSDLPQPRSAEEFLVNSRLRRGDFEMGTSVMGYFTEQAAAMLSLLGREATEGGPHAPLPDSVKLDVTLGDAIRHRCSVRSYSGEAMAVSHLATILRAARGRGSTPSGGGLYPVDLHVAALRVTGLPRGVYAFDPDRDELRQTQAEAGADALLDALAFPGQVISERGAAAVCLLVGRPWRSMRKYGDRGMRYVFLEAGAIAEHINLAAVALGLGSVDCGSFYDDEVHEALDVDGVYEALIHAVFLGVAQEASAWAIRD